MSDLLAPCLFGAWGRPISSPDEPARWTQRALATSEERELLMHCLNKNVTGLNYLRLTPMVTSDHLLNRPHGGAHSCPSVVFLYLNEKCIRSALPDYCLMKLFYRNRISD